ncbi:hypothetical protein D3C76_1847010 [compost metagenome]
MHQLTGVIHDQQLRVFNASTQWNPGIVGFRVDVVVRHCLRRFRRTVKIDTDGIGGDHAHLLEQRNA